MKITAKLLSLILIILLLAGSAGMAKNSCCCIPADKVKVCDHHCCTPLNKSTGEKNCCEYLNLNFVSANGPAVQFTTNPNVILVPNYIICFTKLWKTDRVASANIIYRPPLANYPGKPLTLLLSTLMI